MARKLQAGKDPDWERIVESMASIKAPDRDTARYKLAFGALLQLAIYGAAAREKLFTTYGTVDGANAAYEHERKANHWQIDFLNRLIAEGLVAATGNRRSRAYTAVDRKAIVELMNESADGGVGFKRLLWPSDYEGDVEQGDDFDSFWGVKDPGLPDGGSGAEAPAQDDAVPAQDDGVDMTQQLVERLMTVAEHLGNISQLMKKTNVALDTVAEMQKTMAKFEQVVAESSERFEQSAAKLQAKVEASAAELQAMAKVVKENDAAAKATALAKVVEMAARRKSIMNQLESEGRKYDSTIEELKGMLKVDQSG